MLDSTDDRITRDREIRAHLLMWGWQGQIAEVPVGGEFIATPIFGKYNFPL